MAIDVTFYELCINTIRTLSMDAVQQANSGHPGTAMALAPVMYALWGRCAVAAAVAVASVRGPVGPLRDHATGAAVRGGPPL